MRNLKKVLSLALVFVMVFALMVSAGAVDYSDKDKIENVEAAELLAALKIMTGRNGAFDPTAPVQRGELAKMLYIGSTGSDDGAVLYAGSPNPFKDVPNSVSEYWGVNYVKWAYNKGIISGKSATMFYPMDNVKGVEALKMALTALGYDSKTEGYQDNSNWQYNIVTRAQEIGLLKDIPYDVVNRAMTRDEAAQMVVNMLNTKTVRYVTLIDKPILMVNDDTMMKTVFNMEKFTGILMKTATKGLGGMAGKVDNKETIEVLLKGTNGYSDVTPTPIKGTADDSLVGKEVNVYCKVKTVGSGTTATTAPDTLYGIFDTGASSVVTDISKLSYDNGLSKGYVDGELQTTTVTDPTSYIIRKVGNTTYLDFILKETKSFGKVTLTNVAASGGNAAYTAVTVRAGLEGKGKTVVNRVKQSDIIGGADVAKDDLVVVSQQYNGNNSFKYAVAKAETITGAISAYSKKGAAVDKLTINGTKYDLATGTKDGFNDDLADPSKVANMLNQTGTFYLVDGKIVSYKLDAVAASNYGVILAAQNGSQFVDALVKIVLDTGATETMSVKSAKEADGTSIDLAALQSKYSAGTIVTYSISDGKLNLQAVASENSAKIEKYNGGASLQVGSTYYVVNDSTVFFVPSEIKNNNAVAYKVYVGRANAPKLGQDSATQTENAKVVKDNSVAKVVLVDKVPTSALTDEKIGYIFGWSMTSDTNGHKYSIVTMFDGTEVRDIDTVDDQVTLATGFAAYKLNADGKLVSTDAAASLESEPQVADYSEGNYLKINDTKMYDIASDAKTWTINTKDGNVTEGVSILTGENPTAVYYTLGTGANANKVTAIYVVEGESIYGSATKPATAGVTTNVKVAGDKVTIDVLGSNIKPGYGTALDTAVQSKLESDFNTSNDEGRKKVTFLALDLSKYIKLKTGETYTIRQTNNALNELYPNTFSKDSGGNYYKERSYSVTELSEMFFVAVKGNSTVELVISENVTGGTATKLATITIDATGLTIA